MPAKSVAVEGDVSATAGMTPYTGADSGTWTAGSITETSYANLKSGGKKVLWKASCTFSFSGKSGNTTVTGNETLALTANNKLLNKPKSNVLVDGDQKTSTYGNKLSVSSTALLKTS